MINHDFTLENRKKLQLITVVLVSFQSYTLFRWKTPNFEIELYLSGLGIINLNSNNHHISVNEECILHMELVNKGLGTIGFIFKLEINSNFIFS